MQIYNKIGTINNAFDDSHYILLESNNNSNKT